MEGRFSHAHEILAKFWEGTCSITTELFSTYEVPIRVFTSNNSSC